MKLKGNKILITGGGSGIGLGLAKKFLELGNQVIITGRNQAKLDSAKQSCPELITYQNDVEDPKAIESLYQTIQSEHPDLNVLVNNAGVFIFRNLTAKSIDLTEITKEININVNGTVRTTAAFVDLIKKNKGTILNVSSGLAFVPMMSAPLYCATKAFIHSYSTALRFQLEEVGVEVIELCPPAVKTEMTSDLPEDGDFKMLTTDQLVEATIAGIRSGKKEILPGQASQLKFMSRLAPRFIEKQLAKGSREFLPSN